MTATLSLIFVLTTIAPGDIQFHPIEVQEQPLDPRTFEEALRSRLLELRTAHPTTGADMRKLVEQLKGLDLEQLDPTTRQTLKDMAKQISRGETPDLKDPQLIEALQKLQKAGWNDLPMSPEMAKWVAEMLKSQGKQPFEIPPDLLEPIRRPFEPRMQPMPMPHIEPVAPDNNFRSWLLDQMKNLEQSGGGLVSSEAFRGFIRDLAQSGSTGGTSPSWFEGFNFAPGNWNLPNFKMPNLPNIQLPSLGIGRMPDVGTPDLPIGAAGSIAGPLVWLVVVGLIGLVLWRLAGRVQLPTFLGGSRVPQAMLMHFDPQVADRQQLIRAFETLSLARLGESVQTWNHRSIAERLATLEGADVETSASAARRLADLYEQARYSPEYNRLTDQDFAKARQDLTFLAGTTPA